LKEDPWQVQQNGIPWTTLVASEPWGFEGIPFRRNGQPLSVLSSTVIRSRMGRNHRLRNRIDPARMERVTSEQPPERH